MSVSLTISFSPSATSEAGDHSKADDFLEALAATLQGEDVTPEERMDEIEEEISDLADDLANADTAAEKREILGEMVDLIDEQQELEDLQDYLADLAVSGDAADEAFAELADPSSGCPLAA